MELDGNDEICQLEQLLAAQDSEASDTNDDQDGQDQQNQKNELNQRDNGNFLADVVRNEVDSLSRPRSNFRNKLKTKQKQTTDESKRPSLVHAGDTDSSDDEDNRNHFEKKYDDYGSGIKKIIESRQIHNPTFTPKLEEKKIVVKNAPVNKQPVKTESAAVYSDPVFGIRIVNPLISNATLTERMLGREPVDMSKMKRHVAHGDVGKDWVVGGVIVRKSSSKESQKGSQFCIWTLSDLKGDIKTVALFLFRNAYKNLWKTPEGTVIGVLNPNILDKRDDSKDEACLSVDNPDRVMIIGKSKDFGFCKSRKKNGEQCTSFVNLNACQYCVYHVKQEYQKCSKRSDLQGSIGNRGINDLRNKVLGKDTYIYGGKSYSAIPRTKSKTSNAKDNNRLQSLNGYFKTSEREKLIINESPNIKLPKKMANHIDVNRAQRIKDLERIKLLQGCCVNSKSTDSPLSQSKLTISDVSKSSQSPQSSQVPKLGFNLKKDVIDLSQPYSKKQSDRAKLNALNYIKKNGPLEKRNPHNLRGSEEGKKRLLIQPTDEENNEPANKKIKTEIFSQKFKKMLQATSAHADLVIQHDNTEQDKYFNKLEMKEAMEEKMLNTFKVPCKGVKCLKCSYTNFSASEKCKQEKHPLKVFDTFKRFFKCSNCNNRTTSLNIIPLHPCKNCQMTKWQRAPMMNERKCVTIADTLSIRGEEEKFIGSVVQSGANINLLVPDDQ